MIRDSVIAHLIEVLVGFRSHLLSPHIWHLTSDLRSESELQSGRAMFKVTQAVTTASALIPHFAATVSHIHTRYMAISGHSLHLFSCKNFIHCVRLA